MEASKESFHPNHKSLNSPSLEEEGGPVKSSPSSTFSPAATGRLQGDQTASSARLGRMGGYNDDTEVSLNRTYPSHRPAQRGAAEGAGAGERGRAEGGRGEGTAQGTEMEARMGDYRGDRVGRGGEGGAGGGGRGKQHSSIMDGSKDLLHDGDQAMNNLMRLIEEDNWSPSKVKEEEGRGRGSKAGGGGRMEERDFHNISSILEVSSHGQLDDSLSSRQQEEQLSKSERSFAGREEGMQEDRALDDSNDHDNSNSSFRNNNNSNNNIINRSNSNNNSRSNSNRSNISNIDNKDNSRTTHGGEVTRVGRPRGGETNLCLRSVELLDKLLMKGKSLIGEMDQLTQKRGTKNDELIQIQGATNGKELVQRDAKVKLR